MKKTTKTQTNTNKTHWTQTAAGRKRMTEILNERYRAKRLAASGSTTAPVPTAPIIPIIPPVIRVEVGNNQPDHAPALSRVLEIDGRMRKLIEQWMELLDSPLPEIPEKLRSVHSAMTTLVDLLGDNDV